MSAPEKVVVIWTPADEDTMPATVSAHTPKSRDFIGGAPKWMDGKRLEYVLRADMCAPAQDERVKALVKALVKAASYAAREIQDYIDDDTGIGPLEDARDTLRAALRDMGVV